MKMSRIVCTCLLMITGSLTINSYSYAETAPSAAATQDTLAPRYDSTLAEGIDFAKQGYPSFLDKVTGVSGYEPWGRWTDGKEATFKFKQKLPKKFTLELTAQAFGPNINAPLTVQIGKVKKQITLTRGQPSTYTLAVEGINTDSITLVPAKPISPKSLGGSEDTRLLGVGLIKLKIR
jgi:hypothetical protein